MPKITLGEELPGGDEAKLKAIQKDIKQAKKAMNKLSGTITLGTITTWISVPVAVAELILALPPVLGISIGVLGKITSAKEMRTKHKYKWFMYGSKPFA